MIELLNSLLTYENRYHDIGVCKKYNNCEAEHEVCEWFICIGSNIKEYPS